MDNQQKPVTETPCRFFGDQYNISCPFCHKNIHYVTRGYKVEFNTIRCFAKNCQHCGKLVEFYASWEIKVTSDQPLICKEATPIDAQNTNEFIATYTEDRLIAHRVAEEIMGWKWEDSNQEGITEGLWIKPDKSSVSVDSWNPTQDIFAAFEVVNEMRKNGWDFSMTDIGPSIRSAKFSCSHGPCKRHGNTENDWHGSLIAAKSELLAICLAAIAAINRPSEQFSNV